MSKTETKKSARLWVDRTAIPEAAGELLKQADENDLRALALLLLSGDGEGGLSAAELAAALDMEESEADASLKFWRGAGLVRQGSGKRAGKPATKAEPKKEPEAQRPAAVSKHREGVTERSDGLGSYSTAELAAVMEQRAGSAQFIDEAQRIMGRMFRTYDVGILMGLVDQLGFDEAAVLTILSYIVSKGKTTLRYAERLALALYDEGLTDTAAVMERISRMERSGEVIERIRTLFGMGQRALTATEKKLFGTWTEVYGYDMDVIRLAYDITVDTIQKPAPKYTNSILEKWYTEGLHTPEEVQSYLDAERAKKEGDRIAKSYDVEDFFEAALKRSMEELS
ncbi:MAG: DnaD domain protein [Ruminococcaceae bacterium]|nr:DnaD domain protein [Oscillospiraceae bacterium]